ncbi:hypothetical protein EMCRGX_G002077 [Ephydatia muelleri]
MGLGLLPSPLDIKVEFRRGTGVLTTRPQRTWLLATYHQCLPFGLRSAPALFNHYAKALNWIMANNYGVQLLHYLDDFLLVGPPGKDTCHEAMSRVLLVCVLLGIPVASEKLEGPTTTLTFLGIVLDTLEQQLRLPRDKLQQRWCQQDVLLLSD